jgi:4-hydroxy 2-oxovalerate aldolase
MKTIFLDCTLRDGGYYNNWNFSPDLIAEYLSAMEAVAADYVELGFRSFDASGFKGACAYTSDSFIRTLPVPAGLKIGVMMNAAELVSHSDGPVGGAKLMFVPAAESPVDLVRFACHVHEFEATLPVCAWLKDIGYEVGINLMQVADRSTEEVVRIGQLASRYPLDVLYFADSLGSMDPEKAASIVQALRQHWKGALGIHTHDNMGRAMANTLQAISEGVTWVDCTVTGMGRGPGNLQSEYMLLELEKIRGEKINIGPLLGLIRRHFGPMQAQYGWGKNPFYYLAGQFGIHPTYIQEMLQDPRYGEAEILSVIEYLCEVGGKKFSNATLEAGRQMYGGESAGTWSPASVMKDREVLLIGSGPGVYAHRDAIENFVRLRRPYVIALNTQTSIDSSLIDLRTACHPFRLLADSKAYRNLPQPLAIPASRVSTLVLEALGSVKIFDFGLAVEHGRFEFHDSSAVTPSPLAVAYALALTTSGNAIRVLLAGFDGYKADDPRTLEMDGLLATYQAHPESLPLLAITPTRYRLPSTSIYAY